MNIQEFVKNRPYFVWWTSDYDKLSQDAIVEATLNSGNWEDVQELIRILGKEKVAQIFFEQSHKDRPNYHPKTKHFFALYFHEYAPRNS